MLSQVEIRSKFSGEKAFLYYKLFSSVIILGLPYVGKVLA
jgi:hypothetical protein